MAKLTEKQLQCLATLASCVGGAIRSSRLVVGSTTIRSLRDAGFVESWIDDGLTFNRITNAGRAALANGGSK